MKTSFHAETGARRLETFMHEPIHKDKNDKTPEVPNFCVPPANISESEEHFLLEIALAGLEPHEVALHLSEGVLTVTADATALRNPKTDVRLSEFSKGPFNRSFVLPSCVDVDRISASCNNGMLSVKMTKKEAEPSPIISIPIQ